MANAMPQQANLAELTTMGVGGQAEVWRPTTAQDAADLATEWELEDATWMVLGGGSNVVFEDDGYVGNIIHPENKGISFQRVGDSVLLTAQAGENWDDVVAASVAEGLGGIEALSGIPGSAGAAPVQNIGAYGAELSHTLTGITRWYRDEIVSTPAAELQLAYRSSTLKTHRDSMVLDLTLRLTPDGLSAPIQYAQLADALGVEIGTRVPLSEAREAVITVRKRKSMVFDRADVDSHGCGSFFTNPIVSTEFAAGLPSDVPRWPMPEVDNHVREVKLSAAWLIEHAGISRGYSLPGSGAAISSKHTLAITNRGAATSFDVVQLAGFVQTRVVNEFGVKLHPEPLIVAAD